MNTIGKNILNNIEKNVDEKLSRIYYDKTFPSVIYGKNSDGTYKIVYEGQMYNVPCALGVELKVSQSVWVTMPSGQNNFKDMYISGLRGKHGVISSGGGASEVTRADIIDALGYTPCSPTDVNNKFSDYTNNLDWKESVNTYSDILTTYPNPIEGWTVNVKDTNYMYQYNGTEWVIIAGKIVERITNEEIDALFK